MAENNSQTQALQTVPKYNVMKLQKAKNREQKTEEKEAHTTKEQLC
jgi:hypothetical protein